VANEKGAAKTFTTYSNFVLGREVIRCCYKGVVRDLRLERIDPR